MCDPRRPATVVPGRGNHRRWEFMLLPGEDDEQMMRPEKVAELLATYLDGVPHTVVRAATYRFHGLIAKQWRKGLVFLAGDAAHQTPPFFGQGMCHGLRDVANLAWKLELVLRGKVGPALLETYQPERDPHVRAVISAAVEAGRYICMLDPEEAEARDLAMRGRARDAEPSTAADLIPQIGDGIVAKGASGAGERFIQPMVIVGGRSVLLDDVTGGGWRLFVTGAEPPPRVDSIVPITLVDANRIDDGGAVASWLARKGATCVLVRPDHYVFGAGNSPAELLAMLGEKLSTRSGEAAMEGVHAHA